jgi:hypothetical protein
MFISLLSTMHSLNFIQLVFSLRIKQQRRFFYKVDVTEREMCLWAISKYFGD